MQHWATDFNQNTKTVLLSDSSGTLRQLFRVKCDVYFIELFGFANVGVADLGQSDLGFWSIARSDHAANAPDLSQGHPMGTWQIPAWFEAGIWAVQASS